MCFDIFVHDSGLSLVTSAAKARTHSLTECRSYVSKMMMIGKVPATSRSIPPPTNPIPSIPRPTNRRSKHPSLHPIPPNNLPSPTPQAGTARALYFSSPPLAADENVKQTCGRPLIGHPRPSILPELAKTNFPAFSPCPSATSQPSLLQGHDSRAPKFSFATLDELERREEGRGDTHCLSGAQIRSWTAWQAGAELPCIALLCPALPCLRSLRSLLNHQSRRPNPGEENVRAPSRPSATSQVPLLKPTRGARRKRGEPPTHRGCAAAEQGLPAHRALGPQVRWIAKAKILSVREGDQRDGVIAQTVASELLSYPFHSDTALR
ncbi:uncharacterized protein K444DRAFT_716109 [Hyaloscypha bicolor E]|uniref:Uncharacterized protein n=1 Tax=Hyaloscypha bicolor E TaxID=1095630 RepID=A0A2J6TJJ6_9HELO|nr:uncharacterized protein K444DRAFT_716109 [Hyaloscypha bicolor E]PMD63184.1 hypothetical protein K444DRAFT_716109 [Hyaloscypha bicolor E]